MFPKEKKINEYKTRQISGREISTMLSSPIATSNHGVFRYFIYFKCSQLVEGFTFG